MNIILFIEILADFIYRKMSMKDQFINMGWSVKTEFFEGNKQRIDDIKKQLLDVSVFVFFISRYS
jgi:hypothetical protein